jgi:hypothetical protein
MNTTRLVCAAAISSLLAACATTAPTPALRGHVPVEMTEAAPQRAEGVMEQGDVIAIHTLRARHAVVLEAPVEGPVRDLEAGTALAAAVISQPRGQTSLPENPRQVLWCDVRPGARAGFGYSDCFMDEDGDGRLDRGYIGENRGGAAQFGISLFRTPPAIAGESLVEAPVRPAEPDEHPETQIGFRFCGGDNIGGPLRFALVDAVRGGWSTPARGCSYGVWPDAEPGEQVRLSDGLTLTVAAQGDGFAYTLDGRFEPGPLGAVFDGRAPQLASNLPESSGLSPALAGLASLMESPLVGLEDPVVETGLVGRDQPFVSQPVRHRHTGVLMNRVRPLGLFQMGSDPLEVGTPMYGMPLVGGGALSAAAQGESGLTWCAPRFGEDGEAWAICLPRSSQGHRWVRSERGFYVSGFSISNSTSMADTPSVEPSDVDFGVDLTRVVQFREWDADDVDLHLVIEAGADRFVIRDFAVAREPDGSARFNAFGQWVRLTQPDPGDRRSARIELTEPPETEAAAPADPGAPAKPAAAAAGETEPSSTAR